MSWQLWLSIFVYVGAFGLYLKIENDRVNNLLAVRDRRKHPRPTAVDLSTRLEF